MIIIRFQNENCYSPIPTAPLRCQKIGDPVQLQWDIDTDFGLFKWPGQLMQSDLSKKQVYLQVERNLLPNVDHGHVYHRPAAALRVYICMLLGPKRRKSSL